MGKAYSSAAARARAGVGPIPDDPAQILDWIGQDTERARLAWHHINTLGPPVDDQSAAMQAQLAEQVRNRLPWFDLDDVRFTAYGNISLLDVCELAGAAAATSDSPEGMAALAEFFRAALGVAEYQRLKQHVRAHGTDDDTLAAIMQDLTEVFTARPTQRPSASAPGPWPTIPTSKVVSSSGQVTQTPMTPQQMAEWLAQYQAAQTHTGMRQEIPAPGSLPGQPAAG